MKLIGILPVRNEDWILGLTLRAHLMWMDEVIILDHASTDRTREIINDVARENTGRVNLLAEDDPVWREMAHRQRLLDEARGFGATHIAILDADEILCGDILQYIRKWVRSLKPGVYVCGPMRMMHRSIWDFRQDASIWSRARGSIAFADQAELCWQQRNGYDHHHREPFGARAGGMINVDATMHLQFSHWRRLKAKHALYKITERIRWPEKPIAEIDRLYSLALDETGLRTQRAPAEWWAPYKHLLGYLRIDQNEEQWQEREARRLVDEYGRAIFRGLNLFGVV